VTKKDIQMLLSPREEQTMNLLVQGIKNKQIAEQLGVSEKMVEKLLTKMYRKTNTQCRTELVALMLNKKISE